MTVHALPPLIVAPRLRLPRWTMPWERSKDEIAVAAVTVDNASIGEFAQDSALSSVGFTTSQPVAVNGFVHVTVFWFGTVSLSSVSGGGLTWTIDKQTGGGSGAKSHVAHVSAQAPAGLASGTAIAATLSGAADGGCAICGDSWTNVAASTPVDGSTANHDDSSAAWTSLALTLTAGSVMIAGAVNDNTFATSTPTSPAVEAHDFGVSPTNFAVTVAYVISGAGGSTTIAGTWSTSTGGLGQTTAVAYKAGAGTPAAASLVADTRRVQRNSLLRRHHLPFVDGFRRRASGLYAPAGMV